MALRTHRDSAPCGLRRCPLNSGFSDSGVQLNIEQMCCEGAEHNPIFRTNSLLSCGRPCIQLTPMCGGNQVVRLNYLTSAASKAAIVWWPGALLATNTIRPHRREAAAAALRLIIQTISPYFRSITPGYTAYGNRMICLRSQYIRGYDVLNLKARQAAVTSILHDTLILNMNSEPELLQTHNGVKM